MHDSLRQRAGASVLRVEDLVIDLVGRSGITRVIDGVSFDLRRGEMLGLVGESGCGKSVTVRALISLLPSPLRVTSGKIHFGDEDLIKADDRRMCEVRGGEIGYVFQDAGACLNPTMAIGRQIGEACRIHLKLSRRAAVAHAAELLGKVGIPRPRERLRQFPHQFSGGMRQRVMIAMALAGAPSVLLADEPTTALDVTIQAQILDLLQSLAAELGMSVLMITHDLGVAARVCERIYVMYAGRIVECGNVDDIYYRPEMPYTQLLLASVPRLDAQPGERLPSIPGQPPDVRIKLTGCRFAPRCTHHRTCCDEAEPELDSRDGEHMARCFGTGGDGWILTAR